MAKTYYEILGIDKNADERTIKRAYRKLSLELHPDKNPSAEAQEKFKSVNAAYEVLSDPEKRSLYDRVGHDNYVNSNGQGFGAGFGGFGFEGFGQGGFEDIFSQFFGGGQQSSNQQRVVQGSDIELTLSFTLEDFYAGKEVEISYQRFINCPDCNGVGTDDPKNVETCDHCRGTGYIQNFIFTQECPKCNGTGKIIKNPCKKCKGKKVVPENKKFTYSLKGLRPGIHLRFRSFGNYAGKDSVPGSLLVYLDVKRHDIFTLDSNYNVILEYPIDAFTATIGGEIEVPTLSGVEKIQIPAGAQNEHRIVLPGRGLEINNQTTSQFVVLRIRTLNHITDKQRKLIEELVETIKPEQLGDNTTRTNAFVKHLKNITSYIKNLVKNKK